MISRRHIEESGSQTVAELLREVPGVTSRRGSETAGAAGEQIQGIDSRQVLVLIDGQPLVGARGIKRGVINLDRQSVDRLEQVEVVKGASSALYGSDAIGGVINLITREATAPLDTTGELSGGSFGEANAVAALGVPPRRRLGLFSVEHHQNDGFDLTPTTFDTTGAPFERLDFMGRGRLKAGDSLSFSALVNGYDNQTKGRSNGELGPQEDVIDEQTLNVNVQADWLPRPTTAVQARAYVARYDESSTATLAPPVSTVLAPGALDERLFKVDGSFSQVIGSRQQLQGGAEYWKDTYSGINRLRNDSGEEASIGTAWLQHRLTIGSRVTTTLGVRFDEHSEFGSACVAEGRRQRQAWRRRQRARVVWPRLPRARHRPAVLPLPESVEHLPGGRQPEPAARVRELAAGRWRVLHARPPRALWRERVPQRRRRPDRVGAASASRPRPRRSPEIFAREGLDMSFRPVAGRLLFTYKNINDAVTEGVELDGEVAVVTGLSRGRRLHLSRCARRLDGSPADRPQQAPGQHPRDLAPAEDRLRRQSSRHVLQRLDRGARDGQRPAAGHASRPATPCGISTPRSACCAGSARSRRSTTWPTTRIRILGQLSATGAPLAIYRPDVGRTVRFGVRWSWAK